MNDKEVLKNNIDRLELYMNELLTYKKITDILEIKYYKGDSKKRQLNEISCYYDIEKIGSKYTILEKYPTHTLYTSNRYSKYYNDLEVLILYALNSTNKKCITLSTTGMLTTTNLVNDNYRIGYNNIEIVSDVIEVNKEYIYNFYNSTRKRFKRIFENALDKMQDARLIDYSTVKMLCKKDTIIKTNDMYEPIIYDNNTIDYKITTIYKQATESEHAIIVDTENYIMRKLGYNSINRLIQDGKQKQFYKLVNDILRDRLNIKYYYNAYKIVKGEHAINREVQEIEKYIAENNLNAISVKVTTDSKEKLLNNDIDSKSICIDTFIRADTMYNLKHMIANNKVANKNHIDADIPF